MPVLHAQTQQSMQPDPLARITPVIPLEHVIFSCNVKRPIMIYDFLEDIFGTDGADIALRVLLAALILVLTWLIRRLIAGIVPRIVSRLTTWTKSAWDDRIVNALMPPVRLLILVWGIGFAVIVLELPSDIHNVAMQITNAVGAYGMFWAFFRLVSPLIDIFWSLSKRGVTDSTVTELFEQKLTRVLGQITKAIIVILGIAVILETWGYDVNGLIAGLGIGGLAVALAAQNTIANLLGYFVILADEPFRIGEYVVFNNISGTVEHIGFRSTRIRVLDQSLVSVPNDTVMNASITNWSRLAKRRLNITIGIEYSSSSDQILSVVQAIRDMLMHHEQVQDDSITVQFVEFNASSLDIMVICFINTPAWGDFQAVKQDINLKIIDIVTERGVSMAFPSRTVYVEHVESPITAAKMIAPPQPEPTISTAEDSPVPDDAAN